MPTSPSSSAQHAKEDLGRRLRELRLDAGLTARELAEAAGWHESKTSRIEHARTAPSEADIRVWCQVCDAADQTPDLIATLRQVDSMWVEWKRMERSGLRQAQDSVRSKYERTRWFRAYSPGLVPGIVQTRAYTTAVLSAIRDRRGLIDDVDAAAQSRMERQRVLHEGDHRFAIILEEAVLRAVIGNAEVMAGQLGHLVTVASLPSVSLSIIPSGTDRSAMRWPIEAFWIYDETQVNVELVSGYLTVTRPSEIAQYSEAFTELAQLAVSGPAARSMITAAIDALS